MLVAAAAALVGGFSAKVVVAATRSGLAGRGTTMVVGAVVSIGNAKVAGSSASVGVVAVARPSAVSKGVAVSATVAARRSWRPTAVAIAT